jgi:hypothetical protein
LTSRPSVQVQQPFPPSPPSSPDNHKTTLPLVQVVAPPLTPTSSTDALPTDAEYAKEIAAAANKTFLGAVFPTLPGLAGSAVSVADERWQLAILNGSTLYARCPGGYADLCLRETVVDLLDRADEDLGCDGLVICLDKKDADLGARHCAIHRGMAS